jgi:hypothetical protein
MAVAAWAIWSAGGAAGSRGAAAAATVNQGATPTASAAPGRTVTVSWGSSTLTNGHAVDGYIVQRYDVGSGTAQTIQSGCSGTISGVTCTEADLPTGQWKYTVTPVIGSAWQGSESLKSGAVTVAAATISLTKTLFGAPLPQSTTGSLAGFAAGEGISYRLDAGTPLTGSPSAVGGAGTATISSLLIPSTTDGSHTVYALGNALPFASQASIGIVTDTNPPTVSAQLSPAANAAGWNNTSPVQVALTANDGSGSGVAQITYTTDGTDPTTSGTAQVYTAAISAAVNTTIKYFATDDAGNASSVQTQFVKIDTAAPANSITLSGVSGGSLLSGATVYYRGAAAGSFALTNAVSDTGGSGPASSGTAVLTGTSTGWLHTSSLVTTPAGGPYVSNAFSWSAGSTSSPSESVTGSDAAGNLTTTVLGFVNDSTPPSGGSVDASGLGGTGARYSQSLTLNVAFSKGTDGAGLAATGSQLLRASASLTSNGTSDGSCGSYGAFTQIGTNDPGSPVTDTVPTDNQCYRYEYLVPDRLGNVASYISPDIKVETTTPGSLTPSAGLITPVTGATAQFVSGSTLYYNPAPSGSFTVDASSGDSRSGVVQLVFPAIGGFSGGGSATTPNSGTTFRTTYSWSGNGVSASPGAQSLTATNNAGASATNASAFSLVKDATAPAGGSVDATGLGGTAGRYSTSTMLSIAFAKGTDGGSGLASAGAQLLRASATLTSNGSSDGVCGSYGPFAQVGANDPSSPKSDTAANQSCYRYEYVVADNVGNSTTYVSPDIKVDTTAPQSPTLAFSAFSNTSATGTTVYYRPGASSGSVTLTASTSDGFSGISSYTFPALGSGWTSTPGTTGVNTYSYSAPNPTAPSGSQNVTATNNAGVTSAAGAFSVAADSTAPSGGSVSYTNGYFTSASVPVSFAPGTDSGSGVNAPSGLMQRAAASLTAGTCGAFGAFSTIASDPTSPYADTGVTSGTCYQYRYLISDNVGNQATYTSANVAKVDTQAPVQDFTITGAVAASVAGTTVYYKGNGAGSFRLVDAVTDAASGVASATFPSISTTGWTHASETLTTPAGGPFTSTTFSWTASPTNPTGYSVSSLDNAGNVGAVGITFASDTSAPTGGSVTYADGVYNALSVPITTAPGTDSQSGVNLGSGIVKRDVATLTPTTETCGAFPGTYASTVTLVSGADTGVTTGNCYKYEYLISDSVGNQATYTTANVAKVDTTGPRVTAVTSLQSGGAAGNGKLEVGDQLVLTFNQSLATGSVPTLVTGATEARAGSALGTPTVRLTIPGITVPLPGVNTGTSGYFAPCLALCPAQTATFNATIVLVNAGTGTTVTVTVTSLSGTAPTAGSGALAFATAATITDGAGNAANAAVFTTVATFNLF